MERDTKDQEAETALKYFGSKAFAFDLTISAILLLLAVIGPVVMLYTKNGDDPAINASGPLGMLLSHPFRGLPVILICGAVLLFYTGMNMLRRRPAVPHRASSPRQHRDKLFFNVYRGLTIFSVLCSLCLTATGIVVGVLPMPTAFGYTFAFALLSAAFLGVPVAYYIAICIVRLIKRRLDRKDSA